MDIHLSPNSEAIAIGRKLVSELETLRLQLEESVGLIEFHAVWEMDFRKTRKVLPNTPIEVRPLEGQPAVAAALNALTRITLVDTQNPKETLRVPGVLAVPRGIIDQVVLTNSLRADLERLIGKLRPEERRTVWSHFEAICPKQAMRRTPVLNAPQNINFYWDDTGSSGTIHTAGELIDEWERLIEQHHSHDPTSTDEGVAPSVKKYLAGIEALRNLPRDEHVAIRRPVQPHIRARVRDGTVKFVVYICPVPFVYETGSPGPVIKPLPSYAPHKSSKNKRADSILRDAPEVENLGLYRYEPGHEAYGPIAKKSKSKKSQASSPL